MDQAADAFAEIRRLLSERAEREAARTLDREQRRADLRSSVRQRAAALRSYVEGLLLPLVAALTRRLGRWILHSARGAWLASRSLAPRAARRADAWARSGIRSYNKRRSASRDPEVLVTPAAVAPVSSTPADPPLDPERVTEELERRQLALREQALGPEHPDVGSLTYIIAARCAARGEYDEARMFYERTGRIFEKAFGVDHPEVTAVLNDLAELHTSAGRAADAAWCTTWAAELTARRRIRLQSAEEAATEMAEPAR